MSGVFQVESQGMRRVLTEMQPEMFEHIIATISLYRPGPMEYIPQFIRRMHGEEEVEYQASDAGTDSGRDLRALSSIRNRSSRF